MLKELIQSVKKLVQHQKEIDPSIFGDPIAERTAWTPAKTGGGNFCSHRLVEKSLHRVEFRATVGLKLFMLLFVVVGLGVMIGFSISLLSKDTITLGVETIMPMLFGLLFAGLGGGAYYYFTMPIVFDKHSGHFWRGRKDPGVVLDKNSIKTWTQLGQIHSLQIISEYCTSSGKNRSSYYSYELNLVLSDGKRINVVDHGNLGKLQEDANTLSKFLGKPVWDAA